jgi:RNA-directed DNA polymerase
MGLRLSAAKTRICHLDEGFGFLGFRIQRQPKKHHPGQRAVYTWPSKKALAAVKAKVRALTRQQPATGRLAGPSQPGPARLDRLLPLPGVQAHLRLPGPVHLESGAQVAAPQASQGELGWLRRRYLPRWWPTHGKTALLRCGQVRVRRYRYRGAQIPTPWTATG